jgi:hypothetical protein
MSAADFWWWLVMACLVWYSTITVYVSIRGVWDIRNMLARLQALSDAAESNDGEN